ncbi:hypothetical protein J3E68DRAFT_412829 [Trichoderma sp. SZMC 28012]
MSGCMIRHGSASYSMGMGPPRVQDPQVQLPALCTLVLVRPAQQGTCAACTRCRTRHTLHQKLWEGEGHNERQSAGGGGKEKRNMEEREQKKQR